MAEESGIGDLVPHLFGGFFQQRQVGGLEDDLKRLAEAASDRFRKKGDDDGPLDFRDHAGEQRAASAGAGQLEGGAISVFLQTDKHDAEVGLAGGSSGKGNGTEEAEDLGILGGDFFRLAQVAVRRFRSRAFGRDDDGNNRSLVLVGEKLLGNDAIE